MATKTPVPHPFAPDYGAMFNWGVKLTDFSEIFLMAGLGAVGSDGTVHHPEDAVALGVQNGDKLRIRSRRGSIILPVSIRGRSITNKRVATCRSSAVTCRRNARTAPGRIRIGNGSFLPTSPTFARGC